LYETQTVILSRIAGRHFVVQTVIHNTWFSRYRCKMDQPMLLDSRLTGLAVTGCHVVLSPLPASYNDRRLNFRILVLFIIHRLFCSRYD
jgi:hypothetical protein